ncbi:hypothetical protein EBH_0065220 [Eimeria brunetti]|uniref:Uncharacterized protein n=1 Tax=Eimeria brunetti TaxID=51314 RepID=U6LAL8_9EIME|nr:hypothetical protein EBH_0065220 [Eimeria brunetti]
MQPNNEGNAVSSSSAPSASSFSSSFSSFSPSDSSLSVGFWDAFAAGSMWKEPVLAALSFSPLGPNHILVLATDGSTAAEDGENKYSQQQQQQQQQKQQQQQQEQQQQQQQQQQKGRDGRRYQYGRLLMRRDTIPCKPEFLVNKFFSLVVYSKCELKGRLTPVVTDLLLLPDQWSMTSGPLVTQPHPLYAADNSSAKPSTQQQTDTNTKRRKISDTGDAGG